MQLVVLHTPCVGCALLSLTVTLLATQSVVGSREEYPVGDIRKLPYLVPHQPKHSSAPNGSSSWGWI